MKYSRIIALLKEKIEIYKISIKKEKEDDFFNESDNERFEKMIIEAESAIEVLENNQTE